MNEKKDLLEQVLREEYERLAREEEKAVPEDIRVPDGVKDQLYAQIHGEIDKLETEEQFALLSEEEENSLLKEDLDLYAMLSEEDRKALELGRKMMEEDVKKEREGKVRRKKRKLQAYLGLAAALVLAMAVGVTSMGGPERVIQMMTQMVGDREIVQVDSSKENKTTEEKEEAAYEELQDFFGIDPVRIIKRPSQMQFVDIYLEETGQIARIDFEYKDQAILYWMNASYTKSSWGIDVEDKVIQKYKKKINNCIFEIKEYQVDNGNIKKYSANFKYNGLEYFLVGAMQKEEFEIILKNLFFPQ